MRFYTHVTQMYNKFLVRGYDNGVKFKEQVDNYRPTLYVSSNKKTEYKTLDGKNVYPIQPGTPNDCKEFYNKYQDVDGFEIYGMDNYIFQYISDNYSEDTIKYDISKLKIYIIDIETTSENGFPNPNDCIEELLTITVQDFNTKKITTFGVKPYHNTREDIEYILCRDERDLCFKFLDFWENDHPDIISGWNLKAFDLPYIVGRFGKIIGEDDTKRLSPWKVIFTKELVVKGSSLLVCDLLGISVLDYLEIYKKFTYTTQESYALNHIGEVELGEKKLDHSEFETFKEFYTKNWEKFVDYNIQDVVLVGKLEEKLKLLKLCIMMAYNAKVNFADVFYQVRLWDAIVYNYLKKINIAIPPRNKVDKDEKFDGAFVKEPTPGMYDWVVSFDLASLYPSLIMMYNISPETIIDVKHPNASVNNILNMIMTSELYPEYAIAANGCMYRKDTLGVFPKLISEMFTKRKFYKKKMLELQQQYEKTPTKELENQISEYSSFQQNIKINLNSLYGALGNPGFRYYLLDNAVAVTSSGQTVIKWIESKLNQYLNKLVGTKDKDYVTAIDTDSTFLNMGPLVNKIFNNQLPKKEKIVDFIDKACATKFQEFLDKSFQELADYTNAFENTLYMKRETISDRGIWTAKKRYILNVWDNEGVRYETPKIKIKGMEAVQSSTPAICRKMLKESVPILMTGTEDDMIEYIQKCKSTFMSLPAEQVSFPKSANNLSVYSHITDIYKKGTPIQVRGVLLYNHYVKRKKLDNKYPIIKEGEKIKYTYLTVPNPIREDVISYIQNFPRELDLEKYVDYNKQFNKSFLAPLTRILDAIGWKTEKRINLANFYC